MDCSTPGFPVLHHLACCWSLLKLMSIDSVTPSNDLILCHSLLLLLSIFPSIRVFPMSQLFASGGQSTGGSALISFRIDWFDFAVQGTLKSLLQHHSSKATILWCSAFFMIQLLHPYITTGKTIALTIWTWSAKWCLCFLICCLVLSQLFFQGVSIF